jgi:hypothetical protein
MFHLILVKNKDIFEFKLLRTRGMSDKSSKPLIQNISNSTLLRMIKFEIFEIVNHSQQRKLKIETLNKMII